MNDYSAYATAGACMMCTLAGLFAWLHWKYRDAGAPWFAADYALLALLFFMDDELRPTGRFAGTLPTLLVCVGFAAFAQGLFDYLGVRGRERVQGWLAVMAAPACVIVAQMIAPVPRVIALAVVALTLATLAVPSWRASRREPGVGHRVVAAVMFAYPIAYLAALWRGTDFLAMRYVAIVPVAIIGLTLLVVTLARARSRLQRELQRREHAEAQLLALNHTLEQRVDERTEELHGVVAGLESFNRMVSHDLRGPLAGLSGLAQMVQRLYDEGRTVRGRELLDLMGRQTQQLADLVTDLLTLCHLSEASLERRRVPLDEPLRAALDTLSLSLGAERVAQVHAQPLPQADVDPSLLRQVFVNLIGNALKFTRDSASPRIDVHAARQGGEIVLSVHDNGAGFDMVRANDLFQPFKRLHAGYVGSGIGLTIVRRIVERHGGRAWAEGRPGEGATFFFSLPA
jgi:signal transduction histidine kinase